MVKQITQQLRLPFEFIEEQLFLFDGLGQVFLKPITEQLLLPLVGGLSRWFKTIKVQLFLPFMFDDYVFIEAGPGYCQELLVKADDLCDYTADYGYFLECQGAM